MKNSDIKRKLSALFTTPTAATPSMTDFHKFELDAEISKVEQLLSEEYTVLGRTVSKEIESTLDEEKNLKKVLNKARAENKAKEKKIRDLLGLISSVKNIDLQDRDCSKTDNEAGAACLVDQLKEVDRKLIEEKAYTEVLVESKNQVFQSILVWKERLQSLTKVIKNVEGKYNEVISTKRRANFSLVSAKNELNNFKKDMRKSNRKYEKAMEKWRIVKENHEKNIKEAISNISKKNIKSRVNCM